jgi:hypothetical protein
MSLGLSAMTRGFFIALEGAPLVSWAPVRGSPKIIFSEDTSIPVHPGLGRDDRGCRSFLPGRPKCVTDSASDMYSQYGRQGLSGIR